MVINTGSPGLYTSLSVSNFITGGDTGGSELLELSLSRPPIPNIEKPRGGFDCDIDGDSGQLNLYVICVYLRINSDTQTEGAGGGWGCGCGWEERRSEKCVDTELDCGFTFYQVTSIYLSVVKQVSK